MRRIVMRYVCLCLTMVLSNISPRVKKRFPTLQHLVDAGNSDLLSFFVVVVALKPIGSEKTKQNNAS